MKTRKTLEISAGGESFEELSDFSDAELAEFGMYRSDGVGFQGFTFGRSLHPNEIEGEGLPEIQAGNVPLTEREITFTFRLSYSDAGDLNLELAEKGSKRHFNFPIRALNLRSATFAAAEFDHHLYFYLYSQALYYCVLARARQQGDDAELKKIALEGILKALKSYFEGMLKPKRFKETDLKELKGVRIITEESIESGRNPKSESEIQQEKIKFLKDLYAAFKEHNKKNTTKPKQKELARHIFEQYADAEKKLSASLTQYSLNFKELWRLYLTSKNSQTFVSIVNPIK